MPICPRFAALANASETSEKYSEQAASVRLSLCSTARYSSVPIYRSVLRHHLLDHEAHVILEKPIGGDVKYSQSHQRDLMAAISPESRSTVSIII